MAKKTIPNLGTNLKKPTKKKIDTALAESVLDDMNTNEVMDLKDDPEPPKRSSKSKPKTNNKRMDSKTALATENVEELKKTSLYFPKSIHKMVKQYCLDNEVTMTDYLVELITRDQKKSA